jgi:hypothetical protein
MLEQHVLSPAALLAFERVESCGVEPLACGISIFEEAEPETFECGRWLSAGISNAVAKSKKTALEAACRSRIALDLP